MTTINKPVMATGSSSDGQPFCVGEWSVEPETGRIQRGELIIKLEPKVMETLVYLAGQPGRVVTREELESSVWAGTVVGYDALSSTMLKLRKAFNDSPRDPQVIETIPKKGYRLVAEVKPVSGIGLVSSETDADETESPVSRTGLRYLITLLIVIALGIPGFYLYQANRPETSQELGEVDKVSIAVLPFTNLNNQPEQDYFVDGLTDDIITDLTRLAGLLVISRDSTFIYKNSETDINQIARNLNVQYVLHGSMRRDQDRVRINALLTDTRTGNHIWAERYDGKVSSIFQLQDQITEKIVTALALKLTPAERQSLFQQDTGHLDAYEYFLQGTEQFFRYARTSNHEARSFFEKAIELDPGYARAYAMLAWTHTFDFMNGWSNMPEQSLSNGENYATMALEKDESLAVAHFVRGLVYRERGDYQKALVDAQQAVRLDPSYANGHVLLATLLYYTGQPQQGLQKIKMAIRLNPYHPFNYPFHLGQAYFVLVRYPEAIQAFKDGLKSNPSSERLHVWLAASYAEAGNLDDARWEMEQIKLMNPEITLDRQRQAFPFTDPDDLERFLNGLRKAGLTE